MKIILLSTVILSVLSVSCNDLVKSDLKSDEKSEDKSLESAETDESEIARLREETASILAKYGAKPMTLNSEMTKAFKDGIDLKGGNIKSVGEVRSFAETKTDSQKNLSLSVPEGSFAIIVGEVLHGPMGIVGSTTNAAIQELLSAWESCCFLVQRGDLVYIVQPTVAAGGARTVVTTGAAAAKAVAAGVAVAGAAVVAYMLYDIASNNAIVNKNSKDYTEREMKDLYVGNTYMDNVWKIFGY